MKAPGFSYAKPASMAACLDLLGAHGDDAQVLAGGQSLMPLLNLRLAAPALLVDITGLDDLRGITDGDGHVRIGALERHADIGASPVVREALPLLTNAAAHIAHVAVREQGTIGGSLALADPAAEWPACCLALDADIELTSARGVRRVAAGDFFKGIYETDRQPDELVTALLVPNGSRADDGEALHLFDEVARRKGDFAIAGLALVARRRGTALANVRLALLGVGDRPVLAAGAMAALEGQPLDQDTIAAAVAALRAELDPPEDPAYPSDYRRRVAGVVLERALGTLAKESADVA